MNRFILVAAAAILAAGWPCGPAYANGNVLVPSDNSSDDLGLSGQKQDSAPAADTSPDLPALDSSTPATPPAQDLTPVSSDTNAPKTAQGQAPPAIPHVVEMPVPVAQSTPETADLSKTLKIYTAGDSQWGMNDTSAVHNSLGILPGDVAKHCRLSIGGMANSTGNAGIYSFDMGANRETLLRYDGKLTGITLHIQALCDLVPLPANASFIIKVGDHYSVFLTQMNCAKPPDNVQRLTVHYNGNGGGICAYE